MVSFACFAQARKPAWGVPHGENKPDAYLRKTQTLLFCLAGQAAAKSRQAKMQKIQIKYTDHALYKRQTMSTYDARRIDEQLNELATNWPRSAPPRGFDGRYSIRVGQYKAVFEQRGTDLVVVSIFYE